MNNYAHINLCYFFIDGHFLLNRVVGLAFL